MPELPGSTSRPDVAVIEVDHTGAGTLRLGGEPVDHMVAGRPRQIVRALLDYAATVGHDMTVLTQCSDGRSAMHKIRTNGTATTLPTRASTTQPTACRPAEPRRRAMQQRRKPIGTAGSQNRSVIASRRSATAWLVRHGLWLMLCAQLLLLTGSVTVIVLAPYLWSPP